MPPGAASAHDRRRKRPEIPNVRGSGGWSWKMPRSGRSAYSTETSPAFQSGPRRDHIDRAPQILIVQVRSVFQITSRAERALMYGGGD